MAKASMDRKRQKKVYVIYFGFCGALTVLFLLSAGGGGSSGSSSRDDESAAAVALLGGGTSSRQNLTHEDKSIFDSSFWNAGVPEGGIEDTPESPGKNDADPELLEPANPNNPVNPQTGQPFSDAVMQQFDELRKRFPNNEIIPKRRSPEEKAAEEKARQDLYAVQSLVVQGKATREQITQYYDFQAKPIKDRLELLDYVLKEQGDNMSAEIKDQYEKILEMNRKQLAAFEESKQRALGGGGVR